MEPDLVTRVTEHVEQLVTIGGGEQRAEKSREKTIQMNPNFACTLAPSRFLWPNCYTSRKLVFLNTSLHSLTFPVFRFVFSTGKPLFCNVVKTRFHLKTGKVSTTKHPKQSSFKLCDKILFGVYSSLFLMSVCVEHWSNRNRGCLKCFSFFFPFFYLFNLWWAG